MATTYTPTNPVVGDDVTLTSQLETLDGVTTRVIDCELTEYELTAVPAESALTVGLIVDAVTGEPTDTFTPDVPGAYVFTAYVYNEFSAGSAFDGADSGASYKRLSATQTKTVRVGASMDLDFKIPAGHGLTLRIVSHDGTVTAASLVNPLTRESELAALDGTIVSALGDCVGELVSALGPALETAVPNLVDAYEAHRVKGGGVHPNNDTTNVYAPGAPYSQAQAIAQLDALTATFRHHLLDASTVAAPWHTADDTKNVPITGRVSTLADAIVAYADFARCYSAHLDQTATPAAHGVADAVSTITITDKLTLLLQEILSFWASAAPTAPANAEPGELGLQSRYGFRAVS